MRIFTDDTDYMRFVAMLGDVIEESDLACWNYCVMPNHYHLTLLPMRANLSEAIRNLNSAYAQWWNRRHNQVGHVFQGRFKDQIVQRDRYLLALSRYVVLNPVRAGLVRTPEEWRWSSYPATVGLCDCPAFLDVAPTLRLFGDEDRSVLQARFSAFATAKDQDETVDDRIRSSERILGDQPFKASLPAGMSGGCIRPAVQPASGPAPAASIQ
jgi:REP element-mobilizing transposase RayT